MTLKNLLLTYSFVSMAMLAGCQPSGSDKDKPSADNSQDNPATNDSPGTDNQPQPSAPGAAAAVLSVQSLKTLRLDWTDVEGATHYVLLENPDGQSGFQTVADDIQPGVESISVELSLHLTPDAQYIVQSCNDIGCTDSNTLLVSEQLTTLIGFIKPNNVHHASFFGGDVSLSADGNTLAVGADQARDIKNGNSNKVGIVYVFTKAEDGLWQQSDALLANATGDNDSFGRSVALSADGKTLIVGAHGEDSNSTVVNGDDTNNDAPNSGAVYVFTHSGTDWNQVAYIKANNANEGDRFGIDVAVNQDGTWLAVGAPGERSDSRVINGEQNNNAVNAGAVYVFQLFEETWQQQAYIKAKDAAGDEFFGQTVSLDNAGQTLAVGAIREDSSAVGVNGDAFNNEANKSGAVYVYVREEDTWAEQAFVKASNTSAGDNFGQTLSLSGDGNTLAVAAVNEASSATGIDGEQAFDDAPVAGAVYVFVRTEADWAQQAYLKASNTDAKDSFGIALSLSSTGDLLAIGASAEASNAVGINGNQFDNTAPAGAAYVFERSGTQWAQKTYLKASNTGESDRFGISVALNSDGTTLAVGASSEQSNAKGTDADADAQADNSVSSRGVVYLF